MNWFERNTQVILIFFGVFPFTVYVFALMYHLGIIEELLGAIGNILGGLIGGLLTLLGVRLTLKIQEKEELKKSYNKQIRVIDGALQQIQSEIRRFKPFMAPQFDSIYEVAKTFNKTQGIELPEDRNVHLLNQLEEIRTRIEKSIWDIKQNLDWEVSEKINELFFKLDDIIIAKLFDPSKERVDKNLKTLETMLIELQNYRSELLQKLRA